MKILVWLSNNLRISDNSALHAAVEQAHLVGGTVHPVFVLDQTQPWPIQGAGSWWLHHSLKSLQGSLSALGSGLSLYSGDPLEILKRVIHQEKISSVFCSLHVEPHEKNRLHQLHHWCSANQIECKRFSGALLFNPETNLNKQGKPYQVFTPFYRASTADFTVSAPKKLPAKAKRVFNTQTLKHAQPLTELELQPALPWADAFSTYWQPGEAGAQAALKDAIESKISLYDEQRDIPSMDGTSKLSAHLRFGEISPRQIWHAVSTQLEAEASYAFLRQLGWRDFSYSLLAHWPHLPEEPFKESFKRFAWQRFSGKQSQSGSNSKLKDWQHGRTGYPIVDAGMRQLWQTGWMHNRVRMIVASFLTKHLQIHWREGANWFWDTLVDADLANNSAGWQWVAGCGADAAPYFRIFNPTTQGQKFDPSGEYIKTWVPELSQLPKKYIHSPWLAPQSILDEANLSLIEVSQPKSDRSNQGQTRNLYPRPIVDHKHAREEALANYQRLKDG